MPVIFPHNMKRELHTIPRAKPPTREITGVNDGEIGSHVDSGARTPDIVPDSEMYWRQWLGSPPATDRTTFAACHSDLARTTVADPGRSVAADSPAFLPPSRRVVLSARAPACRPAHTGRAAAGRAGLFSPERTTFADSNVAGRCQRRSSGPRARLHPTWRQLRPRLRELSINHLWLFVNWKSQIMNLYETSAPGPRL